MALGSDKQYAAPRTGVAAAIDEGLRQYMLRVYNYMSSGLAITGLTAWVVSSTPVLLEMFYATTPAGYSPTMLGWIVMFAPLGFVFFLSAKISTMSASTAQTTFWAFAAVMGLSMANIFLIYTGASITRVFFITASVFAGMSLYGYTTKKDLSGWGSFLFMGLIGVIIASVVNIFLASSALQFAISIIGVLVFTGLTAYDTQAIKQMYLESDSSDTMSKKAIMGALRLYLDFINLFIMLLQLFGQRR